MEIRERIIVCPKCKEEIGSGYFSTGEGRLILGDHYKNEHKGKK
jgi:hypothetical protein